MADRGIQKEILIQYSEYRRLIQSEKKLHELMQHRPTPPAPSPASTEGEAKHLEGDGVITVPGASSQQPLPIVLDTKAPPAVPIYHEKGLDDLQDVVDQGQRQLSHQGEHHAPHHSKERKKQKLGKKQRTQESNTESEDSESPLVPWYYLGPGPFQDSD